ncbi:hypothetical protein PUN28_002805 [Cardiocondyla obscurior]|uniref:Uncharacterized protein n=1 Tax=Cardiocondyla obscurior TaxID=286306 RepID=A0AAW2GW35_9HYME
MEMNTFFFNVQNETIGKTIGYFHFLFLCRYLINLSAGDRRAEAGRPVTVRQAPYVSPNDSSLHRLLLHACIFTVVTCRLRVRHVERQRSLSIRSSYRARRLSPGGIGDCGNPVGQSRGSITRIDDY